MGFTTDEKRPHIQACFNHDIFDCSIVNEPKSTSIKVDVGAGKKPITLGLFLDILRKLPEHTMININASSPTFFVLEFVTLTQFNRSQQTLITENNISVIDFKTEESSRAPQVVKILEKMLNVLIDPIKNKLLNCIVTLNSNLPSIPQQKITPTTITLNFESSRSISLKDTFINPFVRARDSIIKFNSIPDLTEEDAKFFIDELEKIFSEQPVIGRPIELLFVNGKIACYLLDNVDAISKSITYFLVKFPGGVYEKINPVFTQTLHLLLRSCRLTKEHLQIALDPVAGITALYADQ